MDRQALDDVFTPKQVEALIECFSPRHHTHTMQEVEGLEEEIADLEPEDDEDDDED